MTKERLEGIDDAVDILEGNFFDVPKTSPVAPEVTPDGKTRQTPKTATRRDDADDADDTDGTDDVVTFKRRKSKPASKPAAGGTGEAPSKEDDEAE